MGGTSVTMKAKKWFVRSRSCQLMGPKTSITQTVRQEFVLLFQKWYLNLTIKLNLKRKSAPKMGFHRATMRITKRVRVLKLGRAILVCSS